MIPKRIYCINCDCENEFGLRLIKKHFDIRGVSIQVEIVEAYCKNCNNYVFVYDVEKENQKIITDAYKKNAGLLTSFEIEQIRNRFGLSQKQLSNIIKCGEKNIARYENGAIQDRTINLLLVLVRDHPEYFKLKEK